jgi:hypothetical protein
MKKKLLIIMLLSLWGGKTFAQSQALVLHHADGTTTDVELYTQPRIEFKGDRVIITSPVLDMEYAADDILHFTYKGKGTSGINSHLKQADYSQENDKLIFHGVKSTDKVAVYKTNGVRVPVRLNTTADDNVTLSLSAISSGVYLLSVNGRTSKFTKP